MWLTSIFQENIMKKLDLNMKKQYQIKGIEKLLKASYISELESALETNEQVFPKKSSFYYNALMWALLSAIPYIVCIGFHIS